MKRLLFLALLPVMAFAETTKPEDGFTAMTNGKDLTEWKTVGGNGKFEVVNGEVIGIGKNVRGNTFLISEKAYSDFDFRFEMKFDTLKGNSGMMFRGLLRQTKNGNAQVYGYQCEHDNREGRAWTAGLYDEARRG